MDLYGHLCRLLVRSRARLFLVELLVFLFRRLNKDEEEETCASLFILDRIVRSNITVPWRSPLNVNLPGVSLISHHQEEADGRRTMELEVRQLCSSTLQSLGDSPRMANVLWPGLLLQLSPAAHGPALPLLLQTSVGVVKRMQEEGRLPLARRCGKATRGCRSSPRATLPQELLARLLFLEDLLFFISDHTWLGCFIASIRRQLAHSDKRPGDKSFLYKCWGTVLMFFPAESIKPQLWLLVEMVNFREEEEREGFARALGLCARQHLYEIFAILEHWEDFVSRVQLQPSAGGSLEVRSHPASLLFHPSLHQSLQVTGPAREDPASQKPVQRRAEFPSNGSASVEGALSLPSVELQSQHNGVDPGGTVGPVV
ncbi:Disintegrin and metalloproteinase domain-containing protein 9 [Platysternon megacephalum]|uniref:Disintegrin and metalloproteinase domain-containing protein 9 n=1 Tax=Platysternon megacephalum TaxID=55544 RepID=A0A4D9E1A3_9SAUR|nr:Disintegrin and metalloproteinase domain-containing protein 9 [Platysternon megacephalum]